MAPNPNPARTTEPMWQFVERVVALESNDFVWSGCYVRKSGYHSTVADNQASWPDSYSIRLPADLRGPHDKGRAIDIKSKQAAAGAAPAIMAKYGARMRAAAKARDPRVRKWREVLGQFDTDRPPEAIDFQSVTERVPDDTHVWHFHWSILTEFVNDPEAYDAMYSVLIGQSLADYQAFGVDDMQVYTFAMDDTTGQMYLCDGMTSRPITQAMVNDIVTLANEGRFKLAQGGALRHGWYSGAYGEVFDGWAMLQTHAIVRADRWQWQTDEAGFGAAGGDLRVWRYGGGMGANEEAALLERMEEKLGDLAVGGVTHEQLVAAFKEALLDPEVQAAQHATALDAAQEAERT